MTELRDAISRERSTRDYSQALAQVLDQARARLAGSSPAEAIALLEAAAPRYGREPAVIELLASARAAQAVEEERIFVQGTLARIESFERLHQWSRALAEAEAALKRYPDQKDFLDRAIGLHEELVREEHALALKRRLAQLEGSLAAGDWRAAAKALATARAEYPEEAAFANLVGRVEQATYRGELAETVSRIRHQLSTASVAEAGRLLDSSQVRFGNEPSWLEIRDSVQLHENYEDRLRVAEDYRRQGNLEEAEAVVWALIAGSALDDRAERLSATIADEKSRRDRSAAIADARKSVQALIDRGNLPEAIEELRSSTIRFPEDPSLFTELRRVEELLRISLLEAEQRVRYEAIQKARNDVTQMLQVGNLAGAIAYLRQLRATYPEDLSIADDLRRAEERQVSERVEAERAARRAALQEARDQVNALLLAGDTSPAIDRLKQMVKQFPEDQTLEGELRKARELEKTLLQQRKREEAERKEADRRNKERLKAEEAQRRKDSAEAERQKEAERKKEAERRRQEEDQRQRDVPPPPLPPVRVPTQVQVAPRLYQPTQVMPAPVALATPPPEPAEVPQQPKPLYLNPIVIAAAVVALAGGGYLTFRPSPVKTTTASVQWNAAPTELSFSWQTGSANPGPQQLALGDGEAAFQASSKEPWITVTPAEGSRLAPITVIANPKGLKAGTYDGSIRIIAAGKEATVPVHLEVLGAAALILQPSSLSFTYRDGGTLPSPQRITASTAGAALAVSVPPQENWLQAVSSGGSVTVSVRPNQMQVGDHRTNIRIARAGNGDARTIPVLLRIERAAGFEVTSPTSTGQAKMLRWSGSLKAGESLTLQGSSATTGQITSGSLPSEPFTVDGVGSGLTIAERPVKANGYRLKIQNTGSEEESSIIVRYRTSK